MSLNRLRWLTIAAAIAFLLCVQAIAMGIVMPSAGRIYGHAVSVVSYSVGVVVFTFFIYRLIERMERKIVRQNEELKGVNAVSQAVTGTLDLDRAMSAALKNAMSATRAAAGEIVIETAANRPPRRYAEGSGEDLLTLKRLARAQEVEGTGADVSAIGTGGSARLTSVPLEGQDRCFGTLRLLASEKAGLDGEASEGLLASIAAQIAMAVHAANLYEDVLRRERESQALYEIAVDISSFGESEAILPSIVERARQMIGGDAAALCLSAGDGTGLVLAARSGRADQFRSHAPGTRWRGFALPPSDAVPVLTELPACPLSGPSFQRVCSPLRVGARVIGELCVTADHSHGFTNEQRLLAGALADLAAIAVQKSTLLEKERQVAVLEERERLAREMHDSLAQVLGYLHLKAQDTQRVLKRNDVAKVSEELADMASIAHEAYVDVREAILALREPVAHEGGIIGTLREYLVKYSRRAGIHADLVLDGDWRPQFSPEVSVQLVRVIQEALTNVRKHANADWTRVCIGRSGDEAVIVVEDNGQGFDPEILRQTDLLSFGLRTMRERIERVGGRFAIDSVPGEGTKVQIFLPVNGVEHGSG